MKDQRPAWPVPFPHVQPMITSFKLLHARLENPTCMKSCTSFLLSAVPSPMPRLQKCRLFTPSLQPPYELKPATSLALNAYWKLCHHKLYHPLNCRNLHEDSLPSARLHSPRIAHLSSLSAGHFPMQTQPLASPYIAWFSRPLSWGTSSQVIVVLEPQQTRQNACLKPRFCTSPAGST